MMPKLVFFLELLMFSAKFMRKKRNNLSEANARYSYIFFVFFYHLISNIGNGYIVLLL